MYRKISFFTVSVRILLNNASLVFSFPKKKRVDRKDFENEIRRGIGCSVACFHRTGTSQLGWQ